MFKVGVFSAFLRGVKLTDDESGVKDHLELVAATAEMLSKFLICHKQIFSESKCFLKRER